MSRAQAMNNLVFVISLLLVLLVTLQSSADPVHHQMRVEVYPALKMLKAQDTITLPPASPRKISFLLHRGLQIAVNTPDDTVTLLQSATKDEPYAEYGLELGPNNNTASLSFQGVIYDPIQDQNSSGLISNEGATLFGGTFWYPYFLGSQVSFELTIKTPANWQSLSQGQLASTEVVNTQRTSRYVEIYPQEEIYLIAGPFMSYEADMATGKKLRVLLRKDEPSLAQKFLTTMPDYIEHYNKTIAPYPYSSFTVIENLWETGYGMPGFTLLGPTVIRLPFIFNSSLPHEILHNWWGNSVYISDHGGNWSEGLTTYMADYWQQEVIGADKAYRLNSLISYDDFVLADPKKDFPLSQFKGRHNSSSKAIGYGKSMMLFHMLEYRFGKEQFAKAIQDFYLSHLFKKASFGDIQKSFEKITAQDLTSFFHQWVDLPGAPQIQLVDVNTLPLSDGTFTTTFNLTQNQSTPFDLVIPVHWKLQSGEEIKQVARLTSKTQGFSLTSNTRPTKISIDPDFHLFRYLYREERPVTLSTVFGATSVHFYGDPSAPEAEAFSQIWAKSIEGASTFHQITDSLEVSPTGALVFVGDNAGFTSFMKEQLLDQEFQLNNNLLKIQGQEYVLDETSSVLVTRLKSRPEQAVAWVRWSKDNSPVEWASRLTHYGNFGILIFKGRPAVLKSTWPTTQSPLQRSL